MNSNISNSNISDPLLTSTIDSETNTLDIGINTNNIVIGGPNSFVTIQGGASLPIELSGSIVGPANNNTIATNIITNANISLTANIIDDKLSTITSSGKVANSATSATNLNTNNAIVARDENGNFSANTITANLTGSSTSFSGNLIGVVTSSGMTTTIPNRNITNTMLQPLTTAGLVANSATTATSDNVDQTIVSRDNTNGTEFSNILCYNVDSSPFGFYSYIGKATGAAGRFYLFGNLAALGGGGHFTCNLNYVNNSTTAVIAEPTIATSRISAMPGRISLCTGAVNTVPTEFFRIDTSGNISTQNGGIFVGNLSGSSSTFTGNLTGVVTSTGMTTTIPSGNITNSMLQPLTTANLVANSANLLLNAATSNNTPLTLVYRNSNGNIALNNLESELITNIGDISTSTITATTQISTPTITSSTSDISFSNKLITNANLTDPSNTILATKVSGYCNWVGTLTTINSSTYTNINDFSTTLAIGTYAVSVSISLQIITGTNAIFDLGIKVNNAFPGNIGGLSQSVINSSSSSQYQTVSIIWNISLTSSYVVNLAAALTTRSGSVTVIGGGWQCIAIN